MIFAQLLLGWLIADFLSGLAHWLEDRHITAQAPLLGKLVGAPNELHHAVPAEFLQGSFWDRNWTTWAATSVLALLWLPVFGAGWIFAGALLGGLFASEVHTWAHRTDAPPIIRALQRSGLWQSRGGHLRHHRAGEGDYCVLTDFLNPWLELIGLWRGLDRLTGKLK